VKRKIKKILIANRGEIALRIIRSCKENNIKTVLVVSETDKSSIPAMLADEVVCIGPAEAKKSYLNMPAIAEVAINRSVDAIHPGYGFLAENSSFAKIVSELGMIFIGPSPKIMKNAANKAFMIKIAKEAGIPVIPGSGKIIENIEEAKRVAAQVGYPIMLKSAFGGGGRGMRIVSCESEIEKIFDAAANESMASFGKPDLYIEKFIEHPRHIEVQIISDRYGKTVTLGERDCSLQRRHQKLIEESPAPGISNEDRQNLSDMAKKIAAAINYEGAGTVEFLYDGSSFYFIEINTRIQVEHPVTELLTGIDIVEEQIKVAEGKRLEIEQSDIRFPYHVIEARINAEDPENFVPSAGHITKFFPPGGPGVRIDTAIGSGSEISPYYDSLIAKLIVRHNSRKNAIKRLERCLEEFVVEGIRTSIPFYSNLIKTKEFRQSKYDTNLVDKFIRDRKET